MTRPVTPCACGAYLRQLGWRTRDLPPGERLESAHRREDCPGRRKSKGYHEYRVGGYAALHVQIAAPLKARVVEVAAEHGVSLREVVVAALADFARKSFVARGALLHISGDENCHSLPERSELGDNFCHHVESAGTGSKL